MRISSLLFILLFLFPGFSPAQETVVRDSGITEPFRGELRYHLSYKGKGFDELREDLPDSLIIFAHPEGFAGKFFGGRSDTLLNLVLWSRASGKTLTVYPLLNLAWEEYPDSGDTLKGKLKKENLTAQIKGKTCRKYSLEWNNKAWKDEFWMWEGKRLDGWQDSIRYATLPPLYYPGLRGIPFRHVRISPEGKATAELREMVPIKGEFSFPALPEGLEILPMPTRSNFRHPAWDAQEGK